MSVNSPFCEVNKTRFGLEFRIQLFRNMNLGELGLVLGALNKND